MLVFAEHAGFLRETFGGLGVDTFFFLSGYLITTLLRVEYDTTGSVSIWRFLLRRALRVLPPLYVVALACAAATLLFEPPGTLHTPTLVSQLLLYFNYYSLHGPYRGVPGLSVVWSLAIEEHFYLLFPILYLAIQPVLSRRRQAWLLWGLCAAILTWRLLLVLGMHADVRRIHPTTDTRMDSILFGCALAIWCSQWLPGRSHLNPAVLPAQWRYGYLPAAVVALLICVMVKDPIFQMTLSFSIQGAALGVIFVAAIKFHDAEPFQFLNTRPVVFIGTISYSLYLVHAVLLDAVIRLYPSAHAWQRASIALALSLMASMLIYVAIEKPSGALRRKLKAPALPKGPTLPAGSSVAGA